MPRGGWSVPTALRSSSCCSRTARRQAAGLLGPWLLGQIVNEVQAGAGVAAVNRLGPARCCSPPPRSSLIGRQARYLGYRFGERTAARLREQLTDRLMRLPARIVERAGTGDLTSRATTDAGLVVVRALRDAAPEMVFALVQALIIIVAVVLLSPLLGRRRAGRTYRYPRGPALVPAPRPVGLPGPGGCVCRGRRRPGQHRRRRPDRGNPRAAGAARPPPAQPPIAAATAAQLRTLRLRSVFFPTIDISTALAVGAVFGVGGLLYLDQRISLGAVVAAVLYLRQLSTPIDTILIWVETLQSSARLIRPTRGPRLTRPNGRHPPVPALRQPQSINASSSPTSTTPTTTPTSFTASASTSRPASDSPSSGLSGAGKSTLGRLIAGVDRPRTGRVTVGGADVADLAPEKLRQHVVLVTQDHHVFADPLRDNLTIAAPHAPDDELLAALRVVGADWFDDLPDGLDTDLSTHQLAGAQAQHVALARVLLAESPHPRPRRGHRPTRPERRSPHRTSPRRHRSEGEPSSPSPTDSRQPGTPTA